MVLVRETNSWSFLVLSQAVSPPVSWGGDWPLAPPLHNYLGWIFINRSYAHIHVICLPACTLILETGRTPDSAHLIFLSIPPNQYIHIDWLVVGRMHFRASYSLPSVSDVCAVLSHFSHVWLFATLCTITCQAPLSMGFSREEYWSGLPFPSLGNLPDPGIQPASLKSPALAGGFFTTRATWEAWGH